MNKIEKSKAIRVYCQGPCVKESSFNGMACQNTQWYIGTNLQKVARTGSSDGMVSLVEDIFPMGIRQIPPILNKFFHTQGP